MLFKSVGEGMIEGLTEPILTNAIRAKSGLNIVGTDKLDAVLRNASQSVK